jgi:hypothetical protein
VEDVDEKVLDEEVRFHPGSSQPRHISSIASPFAYHKAF